MLPFIALSVDVDGFSQFGDQIYRWHDRNLASSCPSCLRGGESRTRPRKPCLSERVPLPRARSNRGSPIFHHEGTKVTKKDLANQRRRWMLPGRGRKPVSQQVTLCEPKCSSRESRRRAEPGQRTPARVERLGFGAGRTGPTGLATSTPDYRTGCRLRRDPTSVRHGPASRGGSAGQQKPDRE